RDPDDRAHEERRPAAERRDEARAADGRRGRGQGGGAHGLAAARFERAVHDHHGDEDAVRRTRLEVRRLAPAPTSQITFTICIYAAPTKSAVDYLQLATL